MSLYGLGAVIFAGVTHAPNVKSRGNPCTLVLRKDAGGVYPERSRRGRLKILIGRREDGRGVVDTPPGCRFCFSPDARLSRGRVIGTSTDDDGGNSDRRMPTADSTPPS